MRQEAGAKSVLFASVLNAGADPAERRARLSRVVPIILALHILAVMVLGPDRRDTERRPVRAGNDDAPVLKLLPDRPTLPVVAATAVPAQAAPRRVAARKVLPLLKPPPLPTRAPEVEKPLPPPEKLPEAAAAPSSPGDTSEAEGGATLTGVELDSVHEVPVSEGMGGVPGGGLSGGGAVPPPLTAEEREEWAERYMETLIHDRFEHVRYPHLASAAGIQGEVMLRVSISSQGRLLSMELLGRCPHPVLCDSAQETVRNAEPFPPPPPELGNPCLLELPFRYHLH